MSAEWEKALGQALHNAEVAVLRLPFGGGVVRRSERQDSLLERVGLLEQNVRAVIDQYESFAPQRERDADDLSRYRSLRATIRHMLRDVT